MDIWCTFSEDNLSENDIILANLPTLLIPNDQTFTFIKIIISERNGLTSDFCLDGILIFCFIKLFMFLLDVVFLPRSLLSCPPD